MEVVENRTRALQKMRRSIRVFNIHPSPPPPAFRAYLGHFTLNCAREFWSEWAIWKRFIFWFCTIQAWVFFPGNAWVIEWVIDMKLSVKKGQRLTEAVPCPWGETFEYLRDDIWMAFWSWGREFGKANIQKFQKQGHCSGSRGDI